MNTELRNNLADLLQDTGHAHHAAFAATDGADPDWSIWYADNLKEPFAQRFDMNFHRSQLIYCLIDADYEHQARSPDSNWPEFYADELIEARGRATVPVLRITSPGGEERWMPESRDIVHYLEKTFA